MPRKVYRIKFRDGSTRELAADSEDEARRLARHHYTGNIQSVNEQTPEHTHTHPSGATYGRQKHRHSHGNVQHTHDNLRGGSNNRHWTYEA